MDFSPVTDDLDATGDDEQAETQTLDSLNDSAIKSMWDRRDGQVASNCYRYGFQSQ